jgi:hypothetical protein
MMPLPRILIILLSMAGMAATLLPWFYTETHGPVPCSAVPRGWVSFGLFLVILFTQLATLSLPRLRRRSGPFTTALAGGAAIWAAFYWYDLHVAAERMWAAGDPFAGHVGAGVYVALGAAVGVAVLSWWCDEGRVSSASRPGK